MEERPESELLHCLFGSAKDVRPEIPSLEGVDDSIDKGILRSKVEQCQRTLGQVLTQPMLKGQRIILLKTRIVEAWKMHANYCNLVEQTRPKICNVCTQLVTPGPQAELCHACKGPIHFSCGFCFDGTNFNCITCCRKSETNPPFQEANGGPVEGGLKWKHSQKVQYIMVQNFVNSVLTLEDIQGFRADAYSGGELKLTAESKKVMVALGFHDLKWMGETTKSYIEGCKSWLPIFWHSNFDSYLTYFYKLSTTKTSQDTCGKVLKQYYTKRVKRHVKEMMKHVADMMEVECADEEGGTDEEVTGNGFVAADAVMGGGGGDGEEAEMVNTVHTALVNMKNTD